MNDKLLHLKEYPAKLLIGRATEHGVLVMEDNPVLMNASDAKRRIKVYETLNARQFDYRYEVVSMAEVETMKQTMRLDLQKEAHDRELPTKDWKWNDRDS